MERSAIRILAIGRSPGFRFAPPGLRSVGTPLAKKSAPQPACAVPPPCLRRGRR